MACNTGNVTCDIACVARQSSRGEGPNIAAVAVEVELTQASARVVRTLWSRDLTAAKTDSGSDPGCNCPASLAA